MPVLSMAVVMVNVPLARFIPERYCLFVSTIIHMFFYGYKLGTACIIDDAMYR